MYFFLIRWDKKWKREIKSNPISVFSEYQKHILLVCVCVLFPLRVHTVGRKQRKKMKKIYFLVQCFFFSLETTSVASRSCANWNVFCPPQGRKEIIKLSSNLGQDLGRMLGSLCNPSPPHPLPSFWAAELRYPGKPALQVFENSTEAFT